MVATPDILCVGMVCVDLLVSTVDYFPEKGKLVMADRITMQIGGCAANAAIDLARIGLPVTIVGKTGSDNLGKILQEKLIQEKVDVSGLIKAQDVDTSASIVTISSDGERSVIHSLGANLDFCFEDIDTTVIRGKKIMLIAGTFLMPSFDGAGTERMLRLAKENEVLCCMDTAWDSTGVWMEKIRMTLPYLDWFMPSYEEARALSGKEQPGEMALYFQNNGVRNVVIKLSSEGCYVKEENGNGYLVPAYNRVQSVDSSGAGDAFCAGFITGLHQGWDTARSARFANAVGAHCIMQVGTTAGVKSLTDILDFMQAYQKAEP